MKVNQKLSEAQADTAKSQASLNAMSALRQMEEGQNLVAQREGIKLDNERKALELIGPRARGRVESAITRTPVLRTLWSYADLVRTKLPTWLGGGK